MRKSKEEDEEIKKGFIHNSDKKLDLHEFYVKYNKDILDY